MLLNVNIIKQGEHKDNRSLREMINVFTEYGDILSIEEVCTVLLIGRNRAYELLNSGALKGFRLGRTWRVPKKSLETFIIQKCRTTN